MQEEIVKNEENWICPLSLEGVPLLPWPKDAFPEPVEDFVRDLSRATETPIELSAMTVLAAISVAAHKKYCIQIKPDYREPVNIWSLVVLPPASRKSKVFSEITLPLKKWELEQKQKYEPLIKAATSKIKTMEARLKELRTKAARAKNNQDYQDLQNEIEKLENETTDIPVCPQIWTSDITPEHLGTVMAANGDAMAVISDEGGIFDILGGLYSDGRANIDLFLQSHSGGSVRVERGSRPPVFMENATLTMGLTIQPEVIYNICRNKKFRGRGLLGRFLFVVPHSNIGRRTLNEPPMNMELSKQFHDILWEVLNHEYPINDDGSEVKHVLYMNDDAYQRWWNYAKTIEAMMSDDIGHLNHITDWAGKLPGAIARIAALLHIMRYAKEKPWLIKISLEDMSAAVKIGHALINHALHVFDLFHETTTMQIARLIYKWLKRDKISSFTQRECLRKFRCHQKPELRPALEVLIEQDIIRESEATCVGRPSNVFYVNANIKEESPLCDSKM